jgi:putative endonuclease
VEGAIPEVAQEHFVYVLECSGGELYTGYATDPNQRVKLHNRGIASKFTRSKLPVKLVHLERYSSKSSALKREWEIKNLTRREKLEMISEARRRKRKLIVAKLI